MSSALVPTPYLTLEGFAQATDLHPELVRRLVTLGLFEVQLGPAGEPRFHEDQLAVAARIERLRCWLGLNYSSIGVVVDLLDRIDVLEAALRELDAHHEVRTRTRGVTWIRRV